MTEREKQIVKPGDLVYYFDPQSIELGEIRKVCRDLEDYNKTKSKGVSACTLNAVLEDHKGRYSIYKRFTQVTSALDENEEECLLL